MGDVEGMHFLATKGFTDQFPDAANNISEIKLDDASYNSLEDTIVNGFPESQEEQAIEAWLQENPDVMPPVDGE